VRDGRRQTPKDVRAIMGALHRFDLVAGRRLAVGGAVYVVGDALPAEARAWASLDSMLRTGDVRAVPRVEVPPAPAAKVAPVFPADEVTPVVPLHRRRRKGGAA
jgi:hypothetical protein